MKRHLSTIVGNRIGFIGGGKMSQAILSGLLAKKVFKPKNIIVSDPNPDRRSELKTMGLLTTSQNKKAVENAGLIVFANKPQHCPFIFNELRGKIQKDALVLSICAGVQTKNFRNGLEHNKVVRSMPNTPSTIKKGCTVWYASTECSESQLTETRKLLGSFGIQEQVTHEDYLDMATALSGTGPAYFFLLMESLVDSGVHMGFPREIALKLVQSTALGSADYAMKAGTHPTLLRNDITSPGGTTAAALYAADKGNFRTVISDAVWAAFERSKALNNVANDLSSNKRPTL
tara:strand:+ start:265 stop:1131 length:867 start_codon:yes stop_codon:yes gene_type:complete